MVKGRFRVQERNLSNGGAGMNFGLPSHSLNRSGPGNLGQSHPANIIDSDSLHSSTDQYYHLSNPPNHINGPEGASMLQPSGARKLTQLNDHNQIEEFKGLTQRTRTIPSKKSSALDIKVSSLDDDDDESPQQHQLKQKQHQHGTSPQTLNLSSGHSPLNFGDRQSFQNKHRHVDKYVQPSLIAQSSKGVNHYIETPKKHQNVFNISSSPDTQREPFLSNSKSKSYTGAAIHFRQEKFLNHRQGNASARFDPADFDVQQLEILPSEKPELEKLTDHDAVEGENRADGNYAEEDNHADRESSANGNDNDFDNQNSDKDADTGIKIDSQNAQSLNQNDEEEMSPISPRLDNEVLIKEDQDNEADQENNDDGENDKDSVKSQLSYAHDNTNKRKEVIRLQSDVNVLLGEESPITSKLRSGSMENEPRTEIKADDPYFYNGRQTPQDGEGSGKEMAKISLIQMSINPKQSNFHRYQRAAKESNPANTKTGQHHTDIASDKSQQDAESPEEQSNSITSLQNDLLAQRNNRFVNQRDVTLDHQHVNPLADDTFHQEFADNGNNSSTVLSRQQRNSHYQNASNRKLNQMLQNQPGLHTSNALDDLLLGRGVNADLRLQNNSQEFESKRIVEWTRNDLDDQRTDSGLADSSTAGAAQRPSRQTSPNFMTLQADSGTQKQKQSAAIGTGVSQFNGGTNKNQYCQPTYQLKLRLDSDANDYNFNNATLGQISQNNQETEDITIQVHENNTKPSLIKTVSDDRSKKSKSAGESDDQIQNKPPLSKSGFKPPRGLISEETKQLHVVPQESEPSSPSIIASDQFISVLDKDGKKYRLNTKDVKITLSHQYMVFELPSGQIIQAYMAGVTTSETVPLNNLEGTKQQHKASHKSLNPKSATYSDKSKASPQVLQDLDNESKHTKRSALQSSNKKSVSGLHPNTSLPYEKGIAQSESQRGESMTSFKRMAQQKDVEKDECQQKGRFLVYNQKQQNEKQGRRKSLWRPSETTKHNRKSLYQGLTPDDQDQVNQRSLQKPKRKDSKSNQSSFHLSQPGILQQTPIGIPLASYYHQSSPFQNVFQSGQSPIISLRQNPHDQPSFALHPQKMYLESNRNLSLYKAKRQAKEEEEYSPSSSSSSESENELNDQQQLTTSRDQRAKLLQVDNNNKKASSQKYQKMQTFGQELLQENANASSAKQSKLQKKQQKQQKPKQSNRQDTTAEFQYPHHNSSMTPYFQYHQGYGNYPYHQQSYYPPPHMYEHQMMQNMRYPGCQSASSCQNCSGQNYQLQSQLIGLCKEQAMMFASINQNMNDTIRHIVKNTRVKQRQPQKYDSSIIDEQSSESEEEDIQQPYVIAEEPSAHQHSESGNQSSESLGEESGNAGSDDPDGNRGASTTSHGEEDAQNIVFNSLREHEGRIDNSSGDGPHVHQQQSIEEVQDEDYVYSQQRQHVQRTMKSGHFGGRNNEDFRLISAPVTAMATGGVENGDQTNTAEFIIVKNHKTTRMPAPSSREESKQSQKIASKNESKKKVRDLEKQIEALQQQLLQQNNSKDNRKRK